MSKNKKSTSDVVVHESKNYAGLVVAGLVVVFLVVPAIPYILQSFSRETTKAVVESAKTPAGVAAAGYGVYKLGPKLKGRYNDWQQSRTTTPPTEATTPTTTAEPQPYGPPNGQVRPIAPNVPAPQPGPALPQLGGGGGLAGPLASMLDAVPGIGPALGGALKALPPGAP